MYIKAILAVAIFGLVGCQLDPDQMPSEWVPERFPNPINNAPACGLESKGYVCDPNRILNPYQRKVLNWVLEGIAGHGTKCPCSVWACEEKNNGYPVSVAIMRKLKMPNRSMKVLDQAQIFAHYLQTERWEFGRCDEGIVILYSKEDEALQFYAGPTAKRILTDEVARNIAQQVAYNFKAGNDHHGLYELVLILRDLLNGNTMYALAPNAQALHGGTSVVTVTISTLIMTLVTFFVLS